MIVSYDEIRRIYRLEKNTNKLVDVEDDFFDSLNEFMLEEKKRYLDGLRNLSSSKARDFSNLKKMVEEIFLIREKKLLNKALICSRTGELSEGRLANQEKKTLDAMLRVLESHRAFLGEVFSDGKSKEKEDLGNVNIVLLKDVPSFIGADMKEYGPFEKDSEIELPSKIANLLVSRKLAREG